MKRYKIIFIILLLPFMLVATPQSRDIIYWNGIKYHVYPSVLHDNEVFQNLTKYMKGEGCVDINTANYYGYVCEYEIMNDTLYLISIMDSKKVDYMDILFKPNYKMAMLDFSGVMYLGYGKMIDFYDLDTPVFESEITVNFENGIVKSLKDNKNKSKSSPYYNDMDLIEYIHENLNLNECDVRDLNENTKSYVEFVTDTLGKVIMAKIAKSSGNEDFDREAMKAVLSIPSYQVIFVKGEYYKNTWLQPVSYKMYKKYRINK